MPNAWGSTITPVLTPVLMVLCSFSLGQVVLRIVGIRLPTRGEALFFMGLTGVGTLGTILLVAGTLGFFTPGVLWTVLVVGSLLGVSSVKGWILKGRGEFSFRKADGLTRVISIFGVGVVGVTALALNVPATTADELSYHLYLPKLFLMKESVFYSPFHVNSAFPLLTEMLYSYGVALKSAFAAKSVHFLFGGWLVLGTYWLGRSLSMSRRTATNAAILLLSLPGVNHQMGLAHTDLALSAFLTGSYVAIFRWMSDRKGKWLILGGILSGLAMGVKYLALFGILIQLTVILAENLKRKQPFSEGLRAILLFACSAALAGSVTYLRSTWVTGNPFYPYLTTFFGGRGLENPLHLGEKGFGKDGLALFTLPWRATFHAEAFGGLSNQWGPIFLGFLPGVVFLRKGIGKWKYPLIVSLLSLLFWFYTKQNLRFLLPAAPFLCLMVGAVLQEARSRGGWVKFLTGAIFCVYLVLHLGIATFRIADSYPVALGWEGKDEYLSRKEASFEIARFVNGSVGKEAKILSQEHRGYYFEGEITRERAYRRLTEYDRRYVGREGDFYAQLKSEGFTHILLLLTNGTQPVEFWNRLLSESRTAEGEPKKLKETTFYDAVTRGKKTHLLYQL